MKESCNLVKEQRRYVWLGVGEGNVQQCCTEWWLAMHPSESPPRPPSHISPPVLNEITWFFHKTVAFWAPKHMTLSYYSRNEMRHTNTLEHGECVAFSHGRLFRRLRSRHHSSPHRGCVTVKFCGVHLSGFVTMGIKFGGMRKSWGIVRVRTK